MSFKAQLSDLEDITDQNEVISSESSSVFSEDRLEEITHDSSNFEQTMKFVMEKPPVDYSALEEAHFTWYVDDLKKMKERTKSEPFRVGNYDFKILYMPFKEDTMSLFLEALPVGYKKKESSEGVKGKENKSGLIDLTQDEEEGEEEADDWHLCVQFAFDVWDPTNPSKHYHLHSNHRYTSAVTDWGFRTFLNTRSADSPVKNNALNITAYVRVLDDYTGVLYRDFMNYDSKKETGYVGFINQGATCYLNSLLQSYFLTKIFRKKVYDIPTQDEVDLNNIVLDQTRSVPLALQRVFYNLQTSNEALSTAELTTSFGWDSSDAFTQHDVQELNRILMDTLETKMKNTDIEGCLTDIFVGKMKSFIRCVNVEYESSRIEDYWDIQLNVKNLKNIKQSFENYVELEMLTGDNKYDASSYGLQDAEKGVVFESFPPVLHIQLKRFEYDFEYDQLVKINDRYEFFDQLDLKPYIDKESHLHSENWEYQLHGVLVHQGDVSMGHYYAMIRPSVEDKWYKFDDDRVTRATPNEVFEQCFGADRLTTDPRNLSRTEQMNYQVRRQTSAYMLVYIRKEKLDEVLLEVENEDVPKHISLQLKMEKEEYERQRKELEEMPLYAQFQVYTNKSFMKYEGFDIGPNKDDKFLYSEKLYDEGAHSLEIKLLKTDPVSKLYEAISQNLGVGVSDFGLWNIATRNNRTSRVVKHLSHSLTDKEATIEQLTAECELSRKRGVRQVDTYRVCALENSRDLEPLTVAYSKALALDLIKKPAEEWTSPNIEQNFTELVSTLKSDLDSQQYQSVINNNQNILLFIKYFDIDSQTLKGLSHIVVPMDSAISGLVPKLKLLMNISDEETINLYEEVGPESIQKVDQSMTFFKYELQNGDILCFSKSGSPKNTSEGAWLSNTIPKHYEFMVNRINLRISPLNYVDEDEEDYVVIDEGNQEAVKHIKETEPKKDDIITGSESRSQSKASLNKNFELWFPYSYDHDVLTKEIGREIGIDPDYLRLFIWSRGQRIPLKSDANFRQMFYKVPKSEVVDIQYEILNVTLKEFEDMKLCKVIWVGAGICREQRHEFMLPRISTIETVIDKLQMKVGFTDDDKQSLLVYTAKGHRFYTYMIQFSDSIENISNFIIGIFPVAVEMLRYNISEASKLDKTKYDNFHLIRAFQFFGKYNNVHGLPFLFELIKGETFDITKARLHTYLGISDKEFQRIRIALYNEQGNTVDYIGNDAVTLYEVVTSHSGNFHLGLDHPDRNLRRGSAFEPSISIKTT